MQRLISRLTNPIIGIVIIVSPLTLQAGTELVMAVQGAAKEGQSSQTKIAIHQGKLRLDSDDLATSDQQQMIYDNQSDNMTIVDHSNQTYMVLDAATMDQFKQQMEMVKKQMQAQLANVPPEQRAMMQKMMH